VGGVIRWLVESRKGLKEESEIGAGTLFSSGLIAGGSLAGLLYAALFWANAISPADDAETIGLIPFLHQGTVGMVGGGLLFLALGIVLSRAARKKLE
jgi:hypothetical protein